MSRIRKYTDEQLINAVSTSTSIRQVLKKLGKSQQGGGSYNQIKRDIKRLGPNAEHFTGKGHLRGKSHNWTARIPIEKILVENSSYTNGSCLKKRLIKEKLLENKCSECGLDTMWNEKKLVMTMDHINGVNNDHRIENIRLLCPNCNSQQITFAGRNKKRCKKR
jgi:5-methylcytosine-specific restriction endonuclease McrA